MPNDCLDGISGKLRCDILTAVLKHVPFEGWTDKSLSLAVVDCNLPKRAGELYFPGGVLEIIEFWSHMGDLRTLEKIQSLDLTDMSIRKKVTECVWLRLEELQGQEDAARRALARLSLPDAVAQAPKQLWATSDMIWRAIGDVSTDGNFYSKRAILSTVLASTTLSWLGDESADKSKARTFLEARIENVMQFEKAKFSFKKRQENWPNPVTLLGKIRYGRRRRRTR